MGQNASCLNLKGNDDSKMIINEIRKSSTQDVQEIKKENNCEPSLSRMVTQKKLEGDLNKQKPKYTPLNNILKQNRIDSGLNTLDFDEASDKKQINHVFKEEKNIDKFKLKWNAFIQMKTKKFTDDYKLISEIGKGGFGTVYKVMMKTGEIYRAAKKIQKDQLKLQDHQNLLSQMAIMKSLDHPNITKLFQVYDHKNYYIMVLELCDGGELFERIVDQKIRQKQAKRIMYQVLSALNYLHQIGIVHRDIKPQNMLFEKKTKLIKIIDFGISTRIKPDQMLTSRVGTPYYIAPQVLRKSYNEKYDIWSLGVVLYMIFFNIPPFIGSSPPQVMKKILQEEICYPFTASSSKFSPEAIDFLKKMLKRDQKKRYSAKRLLEENWLKEEKNNFTISENFSSQALKRLTQFYAVVHTYIVSQLLSCEQRNELLNLFRSIDKDENGIIQGSQIKKALIELNLLNNENRDKIDLIIDFVDTNCSGKIDYTQFLVAVIDFENKVNEKHFEQAFSYFDIDGNGSITFEEVAVFLENKLDQEEIKTIFSSVDKNGDGQISKDEFVLLLCGKGTQKQSS